ncbi:MAG: hypothetical protein ABS52_07755 [Gemmatimonadetes bacterium SCN 70-22]|nr:MAG: hypothetical protein ABS52_07755 [Gemmatimonadetes bacterium SCN 70-22]
MSEESYYTVDAFTSVASEQIAQSAMLRADVGAARGRPTAVVLAELLSGLGAALTRSSARLDEALAGTTSALATLRVAPHAALMRASLDAERPGLLERVEGMASAASLAAGGTADPFGRCEALTAAARELTSGLEAAALRLAVAERTVQLRMVSAALSECGFTVGRSANWSGGRAALTAIGAGRSAVTVELDPARGHINMDLQGMAGLDCRAVAERLRAAMGRHGLALSLRDRRTHGDPNGGVLVRRLRSALGGVPTAQDDEQRPVRRSRVTLSTTRK